MKDRAVVVSLHQLDAAAAPGATACALQGVSIEIREGEQVALIGSSGAGKTSLLQVMACAVPPLAGEVQLLGERPWALSSAARQRLRSRLFLAPQASPLPPLQRVVTAVLAGRLPQQSLWASLRTLWHPGEAPLAYAALTAFDLGDKLWNRVDRLSGGERQRVGLARALVADAELWLVDEPLSALDPTRATQAIDTLVGAAAARGRTLVCSLHQVEVARSRFERLIALRAGHVVYDGAAANFTDEQVHSLYGSRGPAGEGPATQGIADETGAATGTGAAVDANAGRDSAERYVAPAALICR
jgi:phosphonate transport system ATP-binding protein